MKCIKKETKETIDGKIQTTIEIKRVKDEEAYKLVKSKSNGWVLCPKHEFKGKNRPKKENKKEENQEDNIPKKKNYRPEYSRNSKQKEKA
jgi:hypothetical protein